MPIRVISVLLALALLVASAGSVVPWELAQYRQYQSPASIDTLGHVSIRCGQWWLIVDPRSKPWATALSCDALR